MKRSTDLETQNPPGILSAPPVRLSMGGNGNGKGKYRQSWSPYQQPASGISSMANNFSTMIQEIQSLGAMSQLAQHLQGSAAPVVQPAGYQRQENLSMLAQAAVESQAKRRNSLRYKR